MSYKKIILPILSCDRQWCLRDSDEIEHVLPNGFPVYLCDVHHQYFPEDRLIPGAFLEATE